MASKQDQIRTKLANKVFAPLGKTVTHYTQATNTQNERGETESTAYTSSSVTIVPYNIIDKRQTFEAFGNLEAGEMDAAVPYTVDVQIDDKFTIDNVDWYVKERAYNYLPGNVVTIVRLTRTQA